MFNHKNIKHLNGKEKSVPRSASVKAPVRKAGARALPAGQEKKKAELFIHTLSGYRERKSRLRLKSRLLTDDVDESGVVAASELKGCVRDESPKQELFEPSPMTADFMDPRAVYTFMLKGFSTITCTAGGVVASFIPMDPSASGFGFVEWPNLASLFTEFRIREFKVQFVGATNTNTGGSAFFQPVAVGSNIGLSGVPSSYGQVIQQADGRFWKGSNSTSNLGYWHIVRPYQIGWSLVATPTTTPYAGAPGCVQIYGTSQGISSTVALAMVCGVYEFRTRS